jgi:hypothetical protein
MIKIFILLFFVLVLLIQFVFRGKEFNSWFINFFKFFFPAWCFFDESTDTPFLLVKSSQDFTLAYPPRKIKWYNLFYNPQVNFYLAYHSAMQVMQNEIYENQQNDQYDLYSSNNYQLLKNFAEYSLKDKSNITRYQFKFCYMKLENYKDLIITEEVFCSPEYEYAHP